jgi:hypothetical protein
LVSVGKPKEKRNLEISRHRWEKNINMNLKESGGNVWPGFIWPMVRSYKHGNEFCLPQKAGNFFSQEVLSS